MAATILFLDDEQNVLNALRRVFKEEEYSTVFTTSPQEAREKISKEKIAVVVSDHRMPTLTGTQFLEEVKKMAPETARILLTGHADMGIALEAINKGSVYRFLMKPWDDDELRLVIGQAVAHYELVTENIRLTELTLRQNRDLQSLNENLENKVRERTREVEELNKRLEKSFLGSVRVMASLAEVHSAVIGSHSRRVAALSKGMARKMGIPEEEVGQVEVAALLHDVGKTVLPSEVLNKAEHALRADEKEMLKRHPLMGETLVRMVPNMEAAARMVRHHHERFYGGGYPDKLRGHEIPLGSRIIAVADAFDNTLNVRSNYQANLPERIFQQMQARSPGEFDPEALEALGLFLREGDRINKDANEIEIKDRDLRAGMVLSKEIRNARGVLLVAARTVITDRIIDTILGYPEADRSMEGIFIFRNDKEPETKVAA